MTSRARACSNDRSSASRRARPPRARRSRTIALVAEARLVYADSSALVKLVIDEPESAALADYVAGEAPVLATSRIAIVEMTRATAIANPSPEARAEARRLLLACFLVDVSDAVLRAAAALASPAVRTFDAIHLATAERVGADEVLVYDRRLAAAARSRGFAIRTPGAADLL